MGTMTTKRRPTTHRKPTPRSKTTALEEVKDLRRSLLELTRSLLEVSTATIVTLADATFGLVTDAVARLRKQVQSATH
jgi:hypothetical protein